MGIAKPIGRTSLPLKSLNLDYSNQLKLKTFSTDRGTHSFVMAYGNNLPTAQLVSFRRQLGDFGSS